MTANLDVYATRTDEDIGENVICGTGGQLPAAEVANIVNSFGTLGKLNYILMYRAPADLDMHFICGDDAGHIYYSKLTGTACDAKLDVDAKAAQINNVKTLVDGTTYTG